MGFRQKGGLGIQTWVCMLSLVILVAFESFIRRGHRERGSWRKGVMEEGGHVEKGGHGIQTNLGVNVIPGYFGSV